MQQRYQTVLALVRDGWKVTEVPSRLGVSRHSVHSWIARYEQARLAVVPITHAAPTGVPTRSPQTSRRSSANCAASTPAGDRDGSSTSS